MSTESADNDDLRDRISNFLRRNFPQIQMHGGSAAIQNIDREAGSVTIQAIKSRMTKEIPEISTVHADTGTAAGGGDGMGGGNVSPSFPGETSSDDDEGPQAPF